MFTPHYNTQVYKNPALNIDYYPGRHDRYSPVLGSRAHELKGLIVKTKEAPILLELEKKLYHETDSFEYRKLIPASHQEQGDALAKEILKRTLDPYRTRGYAEDNAIQIHA